MKTTSRGECPLVSDKKPWCAFCRLPIDPKSGRCMKFDEFFKGLDLLFPCKHGCGEALSLNDLNEHQNSCRLVQGTDNSCAQEQSTCQSSDDTVILIHEITEKNVKKSTRKIPAIYTRNKVSPSSPAMRPQNPISNTCFRHQTSTHQIRCVALWKLRDAMKGAVNNTNKRTCEDCENFIFKKAQNKEEYVLFINEAIKYIKSCTKI